MKGGNVLGNGTWLNIGGNQAVTFGGLAAASQNGGGPYDDPDGRQSFVIIILSVFYVLTTLTYQYTVSTLDFFSLALGVIPFLGCSIPVTTALAIGYYPQPKSGKDGIQRCEYNFTLYPSVGPYPFYNSETLADGTMIIVRSHPFLFLGHLKLTLKYSTVSFIDRWLHTGWLR